MQEPTYEQVLSQVKALPLKDRKKLQEFLFQNEQADLANANHSAVRAVPMRDFSAERRWLAEHADEYVGQWVALKGDQLISHGDNLREVYDAANAAGHPDALLEQVEASDALPFLL